MVKQNLFRFIVIMALSALPFSSFGQTEPGDSLVISDAERRGDIDLPYTPIPYQRLQPTPFAYHFQQLLPTEKPLIVNPGYMGRRTFELPDFIVFRSSTQEFPGMMQKQAGSVGLSRVMGNFSYNIETGAVKYGMFNGLTTTWYVGGSMSYSFNPTWSVTLFGSYYSSNPFLGVAAYPYVNTTRFGGFVTYSPSGNFFIDVGANTYYDPLRRGFRTDPIVKPTYKIGKIEIGIDVGPVMKQGLERMIHGGRNRNNPTIAPPIP